MKKLLFVSDVQGTINGASMNHLKILGKKLNLLKVLHGADEVVFSLATADPDVNFVRYEAEKIANVFGEQGIKMGDQFYYGGKLSVGINVKEFQDGAQIDAFIEFICKEADYNRYPKIDSILKYVNEIKTKDDVVAVYYADDRPDEKANSGYAEYKLGNSIPYCFITTGGSRNFSSKNWTSSTAENINGVINALDFHLGLASVDAANIDYWSKKEAKAKRDSEQAAEKYHLETISIVENAKKREQDRQAECEAERKLLAETKKLEKEAQIAKIEEEARVAKQKHIEYVNQRQYVDGNYLNGVILDIAYIPKLTDRYIGKVSISDILSFSPEDLKIKYGEDVNYLQDNNSYSPLQITEALSVLPIEKVISMYFYDLRYEMVSDWTEEDIFDSITVCRAIVGKIKQETQNNMGYRYEPERDLEREIEISSNNSRNRINIENVANNGMPRIVFLMKQEDMTLLSVVDTVRSILPSVKDCDDTNNIYMRANPIIKKELIDKLLEPYHIENGDEQDVENENLILKKSLSK